METRRFSLQKIKYRSSKEERMKFIQYKIGDIVQMKKKHPCGSQEWEVMQLGADMRVK